MSGDVHAVKGGEDVVGHDLGIRIEVPIQADGLIGGPAQAHGPCRAGDAVEHIDVGHAVTDFPCAPAGLDVAVAGADAEEIGERPDAVEAAGLAVVIAVFAGEEVAGVGVQPVKFTVFPPGCWM